MLQITRPEFIETGDEPQAKQTTKQIQVNAFSSTSQVSILSQQSLLRETSEFVKIKKNLLTISN